MFAVFLDWKNKNNFFSGLLWAGFKVLNLLHPLKFSVQCPKVQGGFFEYGTCTSSITAFLLHPFFCVQMRSLHHIWKKPVKTHQLNLSVLSVILSTFTSIMQKCSPHFCLPLSACRSSGGLTCSGWAVGNGSGHGSAALSCPAAPHLPRCSCSTGQGLCCAGQTGEGTFSTLCCVLASLPFFWFPAVLILHLPCLEPEFD